MSVEVISIMKMKVNLPNYSCAESSTRTQKRNVFNKPQNGRIFGMQRQRPVQDVDEQLDVAGVRKVPGHRLEHASDQADPVELVQHVQAVHFLKKYIFN